MSVIYPEMSDILITDTFNAWRIKTIEMKDHSEYIEELFGDWSSLRTNEKENMVLSINETYEYVYQNDINIQQLTSRQNDAFIHTGLSESGIYESGNTRFYGISNNIKTDINLLDSRLHQVDVFLQELNNRYNGTVVHIGVIRDNIGLNDDGVYLSDFWGTNTYATTNNIGNDIHDLDFNLKLLNGRHDIEVESLQRYIDKVEKHSFDLNDKHINTLNHISVIRDNIGLSDGGIYRSDSDNTYATTNNIGSDINYIDIKLKSLNDRHDTESTYVYNKIAQVEKHSFDLNDRHINTLNHIGVIRDNIGLNDDGVYRSDSDNIYATTNNIGSDINYIDIKLKSLNDRHDTELNTAKIARERGDRYSFDLNDRHINTLNHISVIRDNIGLSDNGVYTSDSDNVYAIGNVIKDDIHRIDEKLKKFSDEYQYTVLQSYDSKFIDLFSTRQGDRDYTSDIETRLTATQLSIGVSEDGRYTSSALNEIAKFNNVKSDISALDDRVQFIKDDITTIIQTHHHDVSWSNVSNKPDINAQITSYVNANTFRNGTTMLFYQSTVPSGWTLVTQGYDIDGKVVPVYDSILRVSTQRGGGQTSGTMHATEIFNHTHPHTFQVNGSTDGHALSIAELPSHGHSVSVSSTSAGSHSHSISATANTAGSHIHQIYANNRGSYHSQKDGLGAFEDDAERLLEDWQDTIRPAGDHTHSISGSTTNAGSHSHSFSASGSNAGSGHSHNHRMYVGLTGSVSATSITPKYSNMILCRREA